jgi:RNA-directed DNA polymerase
MVNKSERLTQGDLLGSALAVTRRTKGRRVMTQQKSDRRVVPEATRKRGLSRAIEQAGGGKATLVNEQTKQLGLPFGTAEEAAQAATDGKVAKARAMAAMYAEPKPKSKEKRVSSVTMEAISERLTEAFEKIASNKGAAGPDRQSIETVREHWSKLNPTLKAALLAGTYRPGEIRRVWIPKAGGGERGLGIPNVVDRVVQEAVRTVLEPLYEPHFAAQSHGFRSKRSCHTAIAAAKQHVEEGYEWVVDLDLEKFFDRVSHQRLMSRLSQRVDDKRLLVLIGQMLKAKVVMPDGVVVSTDEGVPQGGPLSPLLSNIVLDELDQELIERGHRFVRYADDCNIYVRSERAGQRVMASVTAFIEKRLRLKVNTSKSAVARPEERHFLGFRLRREEFDGNVEILLSERTRKRLNERVLELTPRNFGGSMDACIKRLNEYLRGWIRFFKICTGEEVEKQLATLDAHIRRRLRAIQLKHWKGKRTIAQRLIQMGIKRNRAWRSVYDGRKSLWSLSHTSTVDRALRNTYWVARGLESLAKLWCELNPPIAAPAQLVLALG